MKESDFDALLKQLVDVEVNGQLARKEFWNPKRFRGDPNAGAHHFEQGARWMCGLYSPIMMKLVYLASLTNDVVAAMEKGDLESIGVGLRRAGTRILQLSHALKEDKAGGP